MILGSKGTLNLQILIGRVGQTPELKYTQSGTAVVNLSIATTTSFKNKSTNEWQDKSEWHRLTGWRNTAEYIGENVEKGELVVVVGTKETQVWEDSEGKKHYKAITNILQFQRLVFNSSSKRNPHPEAESAPASTVDENDYAPPQDDLPF